jgi:hypothetical protein
MELRLRARGEVTGTPAHDHLSLLFSGQSKGPSSQHRCRLLLRGASPIGADAPGLAPRTAINIMSSDSSMAEGEWHSTVSSSNGSNCKASKPQPPCKACFFPNVQMQDLLHISDDEADG